MIFSLDVIQTEVAKYHHAGHERLRKPICSLRRELPLQTSTTRKRVERERERERESLKVATHLRIVLVLKSPFASRLNIQHQLND